MPVTQLDITDNRQQSTSSVGTDTHDEADILARWPADRLLAANLDALRRRDQVLAATIAATPIPDSVSMVIARDGSVTYRLANSDGRRVWLGYSSMPFLSAAANAQKTELTGGNLAISTFGHGADVQTLLGKMAFHQAIFVIDNDALRLKLVLGLRDFTSALAAGRLVLVLGDDPAVALGQFFIGTPRLWRHRPDNHLHMDERAGKPTLQPTSNRCGCTLCPAIVWCAKPVV